MRQKWRNICKATKTAATIMAMIIVSFVTEFARENCTHVRVWVEQYVTTKQSQWNRRKNNSNDYHHHHHYYYNNNKMKTVTIIQNTREKKSRRKKVCTSQCKTKTFMVIMKQATKTRTTNTHTHTQKLVARCRQKSWSLIATTEKMAKRMKKEKLAHSIQTNILKKVKK